MKQSTGALLFSWVLCACGETGGQSAAQGGTATAGGSGNAAGQAQGGRAQAGQAQGGTGTAGVGENSAGESAGGEASNRPPAQGAVTFSVRAASPQPVGAACPAAAFTTGIPDTSMTPTDALTDTNYMHKVIDGEEGATVSCRVAPSGGWVFEGEVRLGARALRIEGGELPAQGDGSATITIVDSAHLSPASLTSGEPCVVRATSGNGPGNLQIKAGSMWASFNCAAVEAPPVSSCMADGYFVLENCQQD